MYESVRVSAEGPTTPSRFVATAATSGFDGVVVRDRVDERTGYDPSTLSEEYDVDVVDAVEIGASEPSAASGILSSVREETTIVVLRGGDPKLNRFAAETETVDVLASPMRGSGDVNHVIVKAAVANDVHLEFDFAHVLRREGGPRVQALRGLRKLRELVEYYDAPFVVTASPTTHHHVRAPRELLAVGEVIGFDETQVRSGLVAWQELAVRYRERLSSDFISPGLRRGRVDDGTEDPS